MKKQVQAFLAVMTATTSVWAANTKVSIASQTPQWQIVQAEIALECTNEKPMVGRDSSAYLSRKGYVEVLMRDQNGNPRKIQLPLIANIYMSSGLPRGTFQRQDSNGNYYDSQGSVEELQGCAKQARSRRYIDGLVGKPLKSVYGQYAATTGGITSTSSDFENVTNEHGVSIFEIDDAWDGQGFVSSRYHGTSLVMYIARPSEGGSVNIDGIDTDDIGPQNLNVALEELLEMQIGQAQAQGKE